ncbi:coil containing protein [Vibrio phage VAP7]|uniref:Coil containing protein n=1 Tax=Vibrio phage VAP7 TaxID=2584487 RepID=A0A4Y5TXM3_9CAUD|nr:coil containing protein [Vibrio phage VAP7]QDB73357.1 coil containing protein [Vibrio phage VAP7]
MSQVNILSFMNAVSEANSDKPVEVPFAVNKAATKKLTIRRGRAKNFRSIGNHFVEIDFERNQSTLITSDDNGAGKSTLTIWLPYFVLLDKPYGKKATKPGMVNTINNKDCVCELEFFTNGTEYLVRRGIKPAVFDICKQVNGEWVRIEDEAAMADYQGYLLNILGLEKKSAEKILENIILLGLDKFHPFIEMSAGDRRILVESIWDLGIFSLMNEDIGKQQGQAKRQEELLVGQEQRDSMDLEHKTQRQHEYKEGVETSRADMKENINNAMNKIDDTKDAIESKSTELTSLVSERDDLENGVGKQLSADEQVLADAIKQVEDELSNVDVDSDVQVIASTASVKEKREAFEIAQDDLDKVKQEMIEIGEETKKPVIPSNAATELFDKRKAKESEAETLHQTIPGLEEEADQLQAEINKQNQLLTDGQKHISVFKSNIAETETKIAGLEKAIGDYADMTSCPTCHQEVTDEAKASVKDSAEPMLNEHRETLQKQRDGLERCEKLLAGIQEKIDTANTNLKAKREQIQQANRTVQTLMTEARQFGSDWDQMIASEKRERDNKLTADVTARYQETNQNVLDAQKALSTAEAELDIARKNVVSALRTTKFEKLNERKDELHVVRTEYTNKLNKLNNSIGMLELEIKNLKGTLAETEEQLTKLQERQASDDSKFNEGLRVRNKDVLNAKDKLAETQSEIQVNTKLQDDLKAARLLIGDKEIKADIVKQYLPFMNAKINEYLEALNIFVGFEIDENFEVSMNAPERKNQTLFSLSSGQRARINLAIMLAMREVGNLKSSIQCNLLTCDEIFECLSAQGAEEAVEMMKHKFPDQNIFVVTQRNEEFREHFENNIHLELKNGFTEIK